MFSAPRQDPFQGLGSAAEHKFIFSAIGPSITTRSGCAWGASLAILVALKERSNDRTTADVTFLFVEDDINDVILLTRALSKSDLPASAQFVQNPLELRDYLLGRGKFSDRDLYPVPKVILTDYRLCGASAAEVVQWVRCTEQFRDIPVVVFSSFVPPREVAAVMDAGARAYLEKPIDFSGFQKLFQSALELARN